MTRSLTKELFTPFKDLELDFRSSRKHFRTLSLDESRSPDFDLFSDQVEYSEEEVAETIAGTMEQYMSKTRADYGSGVARPKIEDKDNFELKGQFLKELRTNTFSGLDHEDANKHIKNVFEIVDLFHIPNITIDQEVVLFYNGLDVLTRQIFDSRGAIPSKTAADAKRPTTPKIVHSRKKGKSSKKLTTLNLVHFFRWEGGRYRATTPRFYQRNNADPLYQERRQSIEETLSKFMSELAKRHEENCYGCRKGLLKEVLQLPRQCT
ncbi:hypothetical protein Tco_1535372 [Tanacetum coccineum]